MKKQYKTNYLILFLAILLIVSLACGSSNEGELVEPENQAATQEEVGIDKVEQVAEERGEPETEDVQEEKAATEEVEAPKEEEVEAPKEEEVQESAEEKEVQDLSSEVFEVGQVIEVNDHTIRLNSVGYQGSDLVANFSIFNNGTSDLNVSSIMSFSAKREDGTLLESSIFDCGTSGFDGSVLPGDKLRGDICWSEASADDGIKIYYDSSLFGGSTIVWNAVEGIAETLENDNDSTPQVEIYKVGDLIEVQDQTIRLNSLQYQGTTLIADYSIENSGDSDIRISSIMSFTAKKNDGTQLENEMFDCEVPSLEGKVLPGDRLKGGICWSGATPEDEILIYYEADMFGEGAVVWESVEGNADPLELAEAQLEVDIFDVGDVIEAPGHIVNLNSVEFLGDVLKANFTLENQDTEDMNVSSLLSFYARKGDGVSLEREIFDCGTSLDGTIIPGDILKGDICWSGANADDNIKIYYEPELFGEGAIVWKAK